MLLSTAWFFDHWPLIGLVVDDDQRASIQLECRNIVKKIMAESSTYWNVSFSKDRRMKTESDLIACFVDACVAQASIDQIRAILNNESMNSYDSSASSMLAVMTDQLVNASKPDEAFEIDVRLKDAIRLLWSENYINDIDFEKLCLSSADSWDIYMRSLTPDLPMMLSDYLLELMGVVDDKFLSLWSCIVRTMPPKDISHIRSGYLEAARKAIGPDFLLPSWMNG